MTKKEENTFKKEANMVTKIILEIFYLKDYDYQKMFSIMAYSMLHIVIYLAGTMKHDIPMELDKFMKYLGGLCEEIKEVKVEETKTTN